MTQRTAPTRRRSDKATEPDPSPPPTAGPEGAVQPARRGGFAFKADLDASELDSRARPGATWSGHATDISKSHVWFVSRRMCYRARFLILAVHLIDADPVPLFGEVSACEYDGSGLYRTEVSLMHPPDDEPIREWLRSRHASGSI